MTDNANKKRSRRKPPGGGDEPEVVYLKMSPEFAEGLFARSMPQADRGNFLAHFAYLRAVLEHHAGVPAHEAMVAYDRAKGISVAWADDRWCSQELPDEPQDGPA